MLHQSVVEAGLAEVVLNDPVIEFPITDAMGEMQIHRDQAREAAIMQGTNKRGISFHLRPIPPGITLASDDDVDACQSVSIVLLSLSRAFLRNIARDRFYFPLVSKRFLGSRGIRKQGVIEDLVVVM